MSAATRRLAPCTDQAKRGGVVVVVHHGMMMMGKIHIWSDSLINFVLVPHLVIVCTGKKKRRRDCYYYVKKMPSFFYLFFYSENCTNRLGSCAILCGRKRLKHLAKK